ncbi:MAG: hypothetical protein AB3N28_16915 [Kordiimonas sp.]
MRKRVSHIFACVVAAVTTQAVMAHGGHDERVKIKMADGRLVFETHISARLLKPFDQDGDGNLSTAEFRNKAPEIKKWVGSHVAVSVLGGGVLKPSFFDTPISEGDVSNPDGKVKFVRIIQHYEHDPEKDLGIRVSLFEDEAKSVLFFKDGKIFRKNFPAGIIKMALK